MNIQPAQYHRSTKEWHHLIGEKGRVLLSTKVEVSSPELEDYLPYSYLIVKLNNGKKVELMGESKTDFEIGDSVELELRKAGEVSSSSVIPYCLKAVKLD